MSIQKYSRWILPAASVVCMGIAVFTKNWLLWWGLGFVGLFLFAFRPTSALFAATMEGFSLKKALCAAAAALLTMLLCVLPMGELPLWNGEDPGHRDQYERMAEAILDGHLYLEYGTEEALAKLENPYDPAQRATAGVNFPWDHAYYDGHYYMYFGVVPVFLAFLPFRILTGQALLTYHATQLFVAAAIAGIFCLFRRLAKRFFPRMPFVVYVALSAVLSMMSVWYASAEPALYCTAITAAIALEVWSLYFFVRAVWDEEKENRQILYAAIGALCGALVFGCRPPIGLANIVVIPMLVVFIRQRRLSWSLLGKLALAALPYVVVAAGLMTYNFVRFDDPLEFGQAYQLTVADQSDYRFVPDADSLLRIWNETANNLFGRANLTAKFPYVKAAGAFSNFPILFLTAGAFLPAVFRRMRRQKLVWLLAALLAAVVAITVTDVLWAPYLLERYRMDIYFLLGVACFLVLGLWYQTAEPKTRGGLGTLCMTGAAFTGVSAVLFCLHIVCSYYGDRVAALAKLLNLA